MTHECTVEALGEDCERCSNNRYLRSLPSVCKCGHGQMEHYDGFMFCTWLVGDNCDCQEYEPNA